MTRTVIKTRTPDMKILVSRYHYTIIYDKTIATKLEDLLTLKL